MDKGGEFRGPDIVITEEVPNEEIEIEIGSQEAPLSDLVEWVTIVGRLGRLWSQAYEFEFVNGRPTGWLRAKDRYLHDGRRLEVQALTMKVRYS